MHFSSPATILLGLSHLAQSTPLLGLSSKPNIWLAGDSTMAKFPPALYANQGWGEYLQDFFSNDEFKVQNEAVAGRSARSYWREGRFEKIAKKVKAGDWVVLEFGHNDIEKFTPDADDTGRPSCPGIGSEKCYSMFDGTNETVYTFPRYLKTATQMFLDQGAKVVIGSSTPANPWRTGTYKWTYFQPFFYYSWLAATQAGGKAKGVYFVPHGPYVAAALKTIGPEKTNEGYSDARHPKPAVAKVFAESFVFGLKCGTSGLASSVASSSLPSYLGSCNKYNSTIPL